MRQLIVYLFHVINLHLREYIRQTVDERLDCVILLHLILSEDIERKVVDDIRHEAEHDGAQLLVSVHADLVRRDRRLFESQPQLSGHCPQSLAA